MHQDVKQEMHQQSQKLAESGSVLGSSDPNCVAFAIRIHFLAH